MNYIVRLRYCIGKEVKKHLQKVTNSYCVLIELKIKRERERERKHPSKNFCSKYDEIHSYANVY